MILTSDNFDKMIFSNTVNEALVFAGIYFFSLSINRPFST